MTQIQTVLYDAAAGAGGGRRAPRWADAVAAADMFDALVVSEAFAAEVIAVAGAEAYAAVQDVLSRAAAQSFKGVLT